VARHPPVMEVEHRGSRGCSDPERLASEGGGAPMKGGDCIPPQLSSLGAAESISGNVYAYKSRRSVWESREDLPSVRVLAGA
jgi:hypothetical protein